MANKKINELDNRASLSLSDLMAVGDPSTGYLYKTTISDLKTLTGAGVISFNGRFGAVSPAEGDYSLTQLSDVIITTAANGNIIKYNGSNWVNVPMYTGTIAQYVDGTGAYQTFPTLLSSDRLITEVRNTTGATVTKGTVVYLNGSSGTLPTIAKAQANSEATSSSTYGVVQNDIANNANGYVVVIGNLTGIDTSAYTAGDILWLSPTTAGGVTTTKPVAPNNAVYVGIVTRSNNSAGTIEVKIQNGYELDELHNVLITSVANNDGLFWDSATSLWKNKTIDEALGYTPANDSLVVPYTGATTNVNIGNNLFSSANIRVDGDNTSNFGYLGFKQFSGGSNGFNGYTSIFAQSTNYLGFSYSQGAGSFKSALFASDLISINTTRTYNLPNTNGTLALTSDLSNYVTIGTTQTITGDKTYSGVNIYNDYQTRFSMGIAINNTTSGGAVGSHTVIGANVNGLQINLAGGGYNNLNFASTSAGNTYTLPNATGTIALTTDLGSYLPLSGGTLTGALSGTSASFSSTITISTSSTTYGSAFYLANTSNSKQWNFTTVGSAVSGRSGNLEINNNAADIFAITQAGNVGIGTTSPALPLYVKQVASDGYAFGIESSANDTKLVIGKRAAGFAISATYDTTGSYQPLALYTSDTPRLTIATSGAATFSGNYGTSAGVYLSGTTYGTFGANRGASSASAGMNYYSVGTQKWFTGIYENSDNFGFYSVASGGFPLVITTSGNVGIGTTAPSSIVKLDILLDATAVNGLQIRTSDAGTVDGSTTANVFRTVNSSGGNWANAKYNAWDHIFTTSGTTERMRITSGGNVLIGTTTDSGDKFQVNGAVYSKGSVAAMHFENRVSSNFFAWYGSTNIKLYNSDIGDIASISYAGGAYTALSDINKKKDFEASTIGLDAILGLKPTLFRMKTESEETPKSLGFIAQEVKEFIPQAYFEQDEFIGLQDRPIIAALVKAVQEQQSQIKELKKQLN